MALPDSQSASRDDDGRSRDRALIARIAAAERWARTPDWTAATEPAKRGLGPSSSSRRTQTASSTPLIGLGAPTL